MITLKRFEFDVASMSRTKVNDYLSFPVNIDMSPFTQKREGPEGYSLRGTLNHSGGAESGHYFSLVHTGDQWWEFNDTRVSTFSPDRFSDYCFGGDSSSHSSSSSYLLFYTRDSSTPPSPPLSQVHSSLKEAVMKQSLENQRIRLLLDPDNFSFIQSYLQLQTVEAVPMKETDGGVSLSSGVYAGEYSMQVFSLGVQYHCEMMVKMKEAPQLQMLK